MPAGTVSFTAFSASSSGVGAQTIAQKAASVPRAGFLGTVTTGGTTISNLTANTSAGFTLAEVDFGWDSASTGDNTFSSTYLSQAANVVGQLQSHGYQVAVSAGVFHAPSWLSADVANWQYLDQNGAGSGTANFAFNPTVRSKAAAYIAALQSAMASAGVVPDYYRIGTGTEGETYLPDSLPTRTGTGSWWAFDGLAQASGGAGLPAGVGANPLIGWTPGNPTYSGGTVTPAMAATWWDWYMGAVNNAHQWEIAAHLANGWDGCIMIVAPGTGLSPEILANRQSLLLGPSNIFPGDLTANIAAYWPSMISAPANPANTVLDISSVGDNSGNSTGGGVNNSSEAGDQSAPLTGGTGSADPYYSGWSSVRWLAYLAGKQGVLTLGESVGDSGQPAAAGGRQYGLASQVTAVMQQARECGLYALMWANDSSMNLDSPYTSGSPAYATPAEVTAGFRAAWP